MTLRKTLKTLRHAGEACLFLPLFALFALLPVDAASALGGALGRMSGPLTAWHKRAVRNLQLVFPHKTREEHAVILRGMWDNLGRVFAEFPHMGGHKIASRIEVEGLGNLDALEDGGARAVFVSGHFANWEILPRLASRRGFPLSLVYRPATNPFAEMLIQRVRAAYHGTMIAKEGALRSILRGIREGRPVGMLIDQKFNGGIAVPFLGVPAMTSPAVADLALKYGLPLIPARVERLKGCHFRVTLLPPLPPVPADSIEEERLALLNRLHGILESWILDRPEQWLWVHQRWPKEYYQNMQ